MINIQLDKQYSLKSDKLQYLLVEEKEFPSGKRDKVLAYCISIESVLNAYIDLKIRHSNASGIGEVLNLIKTLRTQVHSTLAY